MAVPVEVPKLGNTVEECLIAKWRKHTGDPVQSGEIVAEIETDKATFEVVSPETGTLLARFFDEGTLVPVFTTLFVVGSPGESIDAFRPAAPAETKPQPAAAPAPPPPPPAPESSGPRNLSPRARRFAREHNLPVEHMPLPAGSGPHGRILEQDLRQQYLSTPRMSGAARQRLRQGGLACTEGSGPAGMLRASDLAASITSTRVSGIREKIARRMRESLTATAQYTLTASANASGLLLLRAKVKASKNGPDININDLVMFCAIEALRNVPTLNAEYIDGTIRQHASVNLGFACDTPRGLIVPVVKNAQLLTAAELALRVKDLTTQAVQGTISPDDLAGGTFTVSNLGAFGIESFTPLLNPPQLAILGVNAIQLKPVRRDGRIELIDSIGLSLTLDHQVIDGAPGARFLKAVRDAIENVESLCTI